MVLVAGLIASQPVSKKASIEKRVMIFPNNKVDNEDLGRPPDLDELSRL